MGTFNAGSIGGISKAEICLKVAKGLNLDTTGVRLISISNSNLGAKRPKDMTLNSEKFEEVFNIKVPSIEKTLESCLKDYK